jgi:hypothetical protein
LVILATQPSENSPGFCNTLHCRKLTELLEQEPGVSQQEVVAESERKAPPFIGEQKKRKHPGRQALPARGRHYLRDRKLPPSQNPSARLPRRHPARACKRTASARRRPYSFRLGRKYIIHAFGLTLTTNQTTKRGCEDAESKQRFPLLHTPDDGGYLNSTIAALN